MSFCTKCHNHVSKVYNCEHTDEKDYCVDCYTELHYYLTEKWKKYSVQPVERLLTNTISDRPIYAWRNLST